MAKIAGITAPDGDREARRFVDFFRRSGFTKESVLQSVDLTYQRSNVYFSDVYDYLAETGSFKAACAKGCAYCCHTMVSVVPPEAFYLAKQIEEGFLPGEAEALKQRVIDHDKAHRGKSGGQRHREHLACPLLDTQTWLCRVHGARPLTCRSMHSSDVAPCKRAFDERDPYIPAPSHKLFFDNTHAYYDAFGTALHEGGLTYYPLELSAALATIWSGENVFDRWLSGEDVFDGCSSDAMTTDAPPPAS